MFFSQFAAYRCVADLIMPSLSQTFTAALVFFQATACPLGDYQGQFLGRFYWCLFSLGVAAVLRCVDDLINLPGSPSAFRPLLALVLPSQVQSVWLGFAVACCVADLLTDWAFVGAHAGGSQQHSNVWILYSLLVSS